MWPCRDEDLPRQQATILCDKESLPCCDDSEPSRNWMDRGDKVGESVWPTSLAWRKTSIACDVEGAPER
jgi:hypothetical protein